MPVKISVANERFKKRRGKILFLSFLEPKDGSMGFVNGVNNKGFPTRSSNTSNIPEQSIHGEMLFLGCLPRLCLQIRDQRPSLGSVGGSTQSKLELPSREKFSQTEPSDLFW